MDPTSPADAVELVDILIVLVHERFVVPRPWRGEQFEDAFEELQSEPLGVLLFEVGCVLGEAIVDHYGWRWIRLPGHAAVTDSLQMWTVAPFELLARALHRAEPVRAAAVFARLADLPGGVPGERCELDGGSGAVPSTIPMVTHVDVELSPPEHGWLAIRIALDDFELDERVSNVSGDPLEELLDLAVFLARGGSGMRRVSLWLEPTGFALDAWNLGNDLAQLLVSWDACFVPPMAARALEPVVRRLVDRRGLAERIEAAVRRVLQDRGQAWESWGDVSRYERGHAEVCRALGIDDPA